MAVETDRADDVFVAGRQLQFGDARGNPSGDFVTIRSSKAANKGRVLLFEGITDRDAVEDFRKRTLLIDAEEALPAAEDEVHYQDLVGLEVTNGGASLGKVADIMDFQSGTFLVVRPKSGKEILVPIVPAFIAKVDVEAKAIDLALPDGFLDL